MCVRQPGGAGDDRAAVEKGYESGEPARKRGCVAENVADIAEPSRHRGDPYVAPRGGDTRDESGISSGLISPPSTSSTSIACVGARRRSVGEPGFRIQTSP